MLLSLRLCLSALALACAPLVLAQAADVPTPEAFLPEHGRAFTPHHRLVAYFEAVAAASPRVTVEQYGTTYEGRPLILAYVSSEGNLADLEGLRQNHLRRSGLAPGEPTDAEALAVVWLSNSVHGNELAGSEASPTVLYGLATATDSLAAMLDNTVVVIDPSLNPDGYTRYTDDYRRRAGRFPDADPSAWEHQEPWPYGRTNHYLFDLNRDWVWASQIETQARLAAYRRWMPHVHADLHEMGANSSYYFAPAAEPFHDYITEFQHDFQTEIGRNHARIFDANGWLYYTRERFDLLYPSYGDTYPTFNGAVGMTYEQSGSGRAGRAYARREGDTLTIAERIAHHVATSLSTIAVASANADRLAAAAARYRTEARETPRGDFEAYVFPTSDNSPTRLRALTDLLERHDIEHYAAASATTVAGERYATGRRGDQRVTTGDVVVPARQTNGVLAQVLLDPATRLSDSLTYDITAWSLPLVIGLEGFAAEVAVPTRPAPEPPPPPANTEAPGFGFGVAVGAVADWAAVAPELQAGAVARYAPLEVTLGGRTLPAGTLFFLSRDQESPEAYAKTHAAVERTGAELVPLAGGLSTQGPDLGADGVRRIEAPTVALLQDDEASPGAFGHVWHFFERRLGYPIRPLPLAGLRDEDLAGIDVLIIADGNYDLGAGGGEAIEEWVRAGGRVIAMEGGAEALARREAFSLDADGSGADSGGLKTAPSADDPMAPYAERQRADIAGEAPGALVEAAVDLTHPLAFGLGEVPLYMLRTSNRPWGFLDGGANVVGLREAPRVVGFVGSAVRDDLEESLALGVERVGRGEVVYAADDLAYRGFWERGMQLLANAVFYR